MSAEEKFDVIIIGAGPAGSACAYVLAREGKSVLMIERGETPGSKNVTGGRLYTYALELVEPGLYTQAPLQRKVVREQIVMLGSNSAVNIDYLNYEFGENIPQSYTILRASFDEWFANKAEEQGAFVASGILVDGLIEDGGKIVGIKAGEDDIYADIVIAADGVNSFIAQKAGLRNDIIANTVGVGVKEIIELPDEIINERFNLNDEEGAAKVILGSSYGITGGGFLYTNKGSISLGMVLNPEQVGERGRSIQEILQDLKMHPAIMPLIEGGKTVEYGAHLVPELGYHGIPPKLYRDGLLLIGDAAGFVINTGAVIRGIDLAIVSGVAAANAVLKNSEGHQTGLIYKEEIQKLALMPSMELYANWHEIMGIPRIQKEYPDLVNDAMRFIFTVDGQVPEKMNKAMLKTIKKHVSIKHLLVDGWKIFRSI